MIVICVVILTVHSNCHPYTRPRANLTESVYLLVLCTLAIMQIVEDTPARFYVCLVLLIIVSLHTLLVFGFEAVRFFRKRFNYCAGAQDTVMESRGYEELDNTQTEQSLDPEVERRRSIMNTIFSTSEEDSDHG